MITRIKKRLSINANSLSTSIVYPTSKELLKNPQKAIIPFDHTFIIKTTDLDSIKGLTKEKINIFRSKLTNGDIGIIALENNNCIGYAWASISKNRNNQLDNPVIELKKNNAYIYYCHTILDYRGRGIYPQLLSLLAIKLFKEDIIEIIIDTSPNNVASQRGLLKVGFHEIYRAKILRLFGLVVWNKKVVSN
jgi:ribosomal protein S18 acetylase RimI-like enzyme